MKPITTMKITGITLENFRNHTEAETFEFGDISTISGHNGTGKTTMAHAVCYALYGVSFTGEQKIERLMNEKAESVKVQLDFTDQNGHAHALVRSRWKDKTALTLDGYTVQQTAIEQMFGEKDVFLSVFNPLYLPECMGNAGRELILRFLPPVSKEEVLAALPNEKPLLEKLDLETRSPEEALKQLRAEIRRAEQQSDVLTGHIESIAEARKTAEQTLDALYTEKQTTEEEIARLKAKQFEGLDRSDLAVQRDILSRKLTEAGENPAAAVVREKLAEAKGRSYVSKLREPFAEAQAEYKALGAQYKGLSERLRTVKVGEVCPTCRMAVTAANLAEYKANLTAECQKIAEQGKGAKERCQEILALDRKAKEQFEQYKADDIAKYTAELASLSGSSGNREEIAAKLARLEELETYGNLSEEELSRLRELEATLIGITAQLEAVEGQANEEKMKTLLAERDAFEDRIAKSKQTVSALNEYIFKRAELATKALVMPNVKIRLFDVIRTTGEVKSTFRFSYKGRDYTSLSLSEKMLAGMELAALMRTLTGKDYPVCIDNTESIASFGAAKLPSQVFLLRVAKGQPLTVKAQNRQTLKKAA